MIYSRNVGDSVISYYPDHFSEGCLFHPNVGMENLSSWFLSHSMSISKRTDLLQGPERCSIRCYCFSLKCEQLFLF